MMMDVVYIKRETWFQYYLLVVASNKDCVGCRTAPRGGDGGGVPKRWCDRCTLYTGNVVQMDDSKVHDVVAVDETQNQHRRERLRRFERARDSAGAKPAFPRHRWREVSPNFCILSESRRVPSTSYPVACSHLFDRICRSKKPCPHSLPYNQIPTGRRSANSKRLPSHFRLTRRIKQREHRNL
jgi:hypothetical protein